MFYSWVGLKKKNKLQRNHATLWQKTAKLTADISHTTAPKTRGASSYFHKKSKYNLLQTHKQMNSV